MTKPGRIKTFRAKTLQEALNRIRTELGPDAEILETKPVRGGLIHLGRSRIQVTASSYLLDQSETVQQPAVPPTAESNRTPKTSFPTPGSSTTSFNNTTSTNTTAHTNFSAQPYSAPSDQYSKPSQFHGPQFLGPNQYSHREFHRDFKTVYAELVAAQIPPATAQRWIEAAHETCGPTPADPWLVRAAIAQQIRALLPVASPLELHSEEQHRIAFVGLSGVGKTTTLAKLACMLANDHGLQIGILSTDTRTGSNNMLLQRSASLMDWKFASAANTAEIEKSLHDMSDCDAVLIDTPPWFHDDSESIEWFEKLFVATQPNKTHVLINAATTPHTFSRTIAALDWLIAPELILTKLDEAGGIGSLFDSICNHCLPVSFTTAGTRIPNDIAQATSSRLAQYIMGTA